MNFIVKIFVISIGIKIFLILLHNIAEDISTFIVFSVANFDENTQYNQGKINSKYETQFQILPYEESVYHHNYKSNNDKIHQVNAPNDHAPSSKIGILLTKDIRDTDQVTNIQEQLVSLKITSSEPKQSNKLGENFYTINQNENNFKHSKRINEEVKKAKHLNIDGNNDFDDWNRNAEKDLVTRHKVFEYEVDMPTTPNTLVPKFILTRSTFNIIK